VRPGKSSACECMIASYIAIRRKRYSTYGNIPYSGQLASKTGSDKYTHEVWQTTTWTQSEIVEVPISNEGVEQL
jgi:hypothetical protein